MGDGFYQTVSIQANLGSAMDSNLVGFFHSRCICLMVGCTGLFIKLW